MITDDCELALLVSAIGESIFSNDFYRFQPFHSFACRTLSIIIDFMWTHTHTVRSARSVQWTSSAEIKTGKLSDDDDNFLLLGCLNKHWNVEHHHWRFTSQAWSHFRLDLKLLS